MTEPNETYTRIQSVRIKNLEQQVHLMHRELQRIREGMFHQHDVDKLGNLMKRLKELNLILIDLRNYYNGMQQSVFKQEFRNKPISNCHTVQQNESGEKNNVGNFEKNIENQQHSEKKQQDKFERCQYSNVEHGNKQLRSDNECKSYPRENAGLDCSVSSPETTRDSGLSEQETSVIEKEVKEPFKTCKQLMDEIKPPSSVLGKYLTRLQDFRTDPELRRQRWEKKQQEKLQMIQSRKRSLEDQISLPDENAFNLPIIKKNLSNVINEIVSHIEKETVALTVVLENDLVYHISVSQISNGQSLACFLATEEAVQEAKQQHLFQNFLTFYVVNAENSISQKDRILGHLFEFMKMDI